MVRTEGMCLPEGKVGDIQDYKYLGIPQANRPSHGEASNSQIPVEGKTGTEPWQ